MAELHCSIRGVSFAALRTVLAALEPPARERNSLEFRWRSDELDIEFEPITPPGPQMDYLGSGPIMASRAEADAYCEHLFEKLLAADLVARVELHDDTQLLHVRQHPAFSVTLELHGEVHARGSLEAQLAPLGFRRISGYKLGWEHPHAYVTFEQTGEAVGAASAYLVHGEVSTERATSIVRHLDTIDATYVLELYDDASESPRMAWRTADIQPLHVGFTGTRFGATEPQLARLRSELTKLGANVVAHHGDCIGADAQFHAIARELGWRVVVHPPVGDDDDRARCDHDELREPLTHMKRNKAIVLETQRMIAVPRDMTEQPHGGTWKTVVMARKAKKPLVIVLPDGTTEGAWP